jgi:hypothetical protein
MIVNVHGFLFPDFASSGRKNCSIARVLIDVMSTEAKLGWDGLGRRRADESAHAERIVVEESNKA